MSGPDEADRDKGFLARWSQRKQEAKQPEPERDAPAEEANVLPEQVAEAAAEPEFDLSSLPKIEELTEATDLTAFLRKGVPEHLRNAALRKSWALDPAIRNYVNPALEYAYDWNTPGGVPGGGEFGADVDVARLVSHIMGEPGGETTSSDASSADQAEGSVEPSELEHFPVRSVRRADEPAAEAEDVSKAESDADEAVLADDSRSAKPAAPQQRVRRHGTAKPIV